MNFLVKLLITNAVIVGCAGIGKKFPSLAGLIATMPLTSLLVLFWIYSGNPGDYRSLVAYNRGVLFGIGPTVLFFLASLVCLSRQLPLSLSLAAGGCAWLAGALLHQWLLR